VYLQFTGINIALNQTTGALRRFPFYCVRDADGLTPYPSLTFAAGEIHISKNGATEVNYTGTTTELAEGLYYYEAAIAEVDTQGFLTFRMDKSGVRSFVLITEIGNLGRIGTPANDTIAQDIAALATTLAAHTVSIAALQADLPQRITKNVAHSNFMFKMVLTSDPLLPATGKTVVAQRSLDGAAFAACANSPAEISAGWYKINFAAADLNADNVALKFTVADSSAVQLDILITTQPT